MSGIAGVYCRDGSSVPEEWLQAMSEALRHRGSDATGLWTSGDVGMVYRGFHTTPEARHEEQPLTSADGAVVLAADARIDNRDELLLHLDSVRAPREVVTDADLILAAYQKWGMDLGRYLIGAFAAVLWDDRERRLLCLRDHAGLRPLFYYSDPRRFVFASEIKALFRVPGVPRAVNEARIAAHLTTLFPRDPTMTWFEGITRLPPAHVLGIRREHTTLRRYWSLDPEREIQLPTDEAYAEAFRAHFTEAVRCRLRRTTPVGSTLSGGLDSSSIACTARHLLKEENEILHTFTAIFPDVPESWRARIDERRYVEAVLQQGSFEPHFFRADQHSPLWQYDKISRHVDEAIWAPNLYLHTGMYEQAQAHGVRILLDGVDGDSVVSHGLEYLAELFYANKWERLEQEVDALARRGGHPPGRYVRDHLYPHLQRHAQNGRRRDVFYAVLQLGRRFGIPTRELASLHMLPALMSDQLLQRWRSQRGVHNPEYPPLIRDDFARRMGIPSEDRYFSDVLSNDFRTAREGHIHFLSDILFGPLFELTDKVSAIFNVEARYPFFDRRLIEFCVALPPNQKLREGWTRYVLRAALQGILPAEVQWRVGKSNLGGNFVRNMLRMEEEKLRRMVHDHHGRLAPYVDRSALTARLEALNQMDDATQDNGAMRDLYTALMLYSWFTNVQKKI